MNIEINVAKGNLVFLAIFVIILFLADAMASTPNPLTGVGHDPSEIGQGIFGWEPDSLYTFPNNLNVNNMLTTKDLNMTNSITFGGTTKVYWPYSDCRDYISGYVYGASSVSCPSDHPVPLRGGCFSNCSWLAVNEVVGTTQYCNVITTPNDNYCTGKGQNYVTSRITCCKV